MWVWVWVCMVWYGMVWCGARRFKPTPVLGRIGRGEWRHPSVKQMTGKTAFWNKVSLGIFLPRLCGLPWAGNLARQADTQLGKAAQGTVQ